MRHYLAFSDELRSCISYSYATNTIADFTRTRSELLPRMPPSASRYIKLPMPEDKQHANPTFSNGITHSLTKNSKSG